VSQNNETAAMLVSQTNPVGVELFSYANAFFCSNKFAWMLATWVKTLYWVKFDYCVKRLTQLSAGQNRLNQMYGAKQLTFVTWDPFFDSSEYLHVLFLFPIEHLIVYEEK